LLYTTIKLLSVEESKARNAS